MDVVEAHGRLALDEDRDAFPLSVEIDSPTGLRVDGWPVAAAALASLSGRLEECETDADLIDAVEHGWCLLNAGVLDEELVAQEAVEVFNAVVRWGDAMVKKLAGA
jgi:hypothetical protein